MANQNERGPVRPVEPPADLAEARDRAKFEAMHWLDVTLDKYGSLTGRLSTLATPTSSEFNDVRAEMLRLVQSLAGRLALAAGISESEWEAYGRERDRKNGLEDSGHDE